MKLLETFVMISARDEGLRIGLKNANKYARGQVYEMNQMFKSLQLPTLNWRTILAGAGIVYGLKKSFDAFVLSAVNAGDALQDMSNRTGISASELSGFDYVAKITGTDMNAFERSVRFLSSSMLDVSRGTGQGKKTFDELGISVTTGSGKLKSTTDIIKEAADKIGNMTDETRQAAYAADLFGARTGTQLLPMLKLGSRGIDELIKKARELGIVWEDKDAKAADDFSDSLKTLYASVDGLKRLVATSLIPTLNKWVNSATEIIAKNRAIIAENISGWVQNLLNVTKMLYQYRGFIGEVFLIASMVLVASWIGKITIGVIALTRALIALKAAQIGTILMSAPGMAAIATGLALYGGYKVGKYMQKIYNEAQTEIPVSVEYKTKSVNIDDVLKKHNETLKRLQEKMGKGSVITGISLQKPFLPPSYEALSGFYVDEKTNNEIISLSEEQKKQLLNIKKEYQRAHLELTTSGFARERAEIESWYNEQRELLKGNKEALNVLSQTKGMKLQLIDRDEVNATKKLLNEQSEEARRVWEEDLAEVRRVRAENLEQAKQLDMELKKRTQDMIEDARAFGQYWGSMLYDMAANSALTFRNIFKMFEQMLIKMSIQAAMSGLYGELKGLSFWETVGSFFKSAPIPGMEAAPVGGGSGVGVTGKVASGNNLYVKIEGNTADRILSIVYDDIDNRGVLSNLVRT